MEMENIKQAAKNIKHQVEAALTVEQAEWKKITQKNFTGCCQIWLSYMWVHPENEDSIPPTKAMIHAVVDELATLSHFKGVDLDAVRADLYQKFGAPVFHVELTEHELEVVGQALANYQESEEEHAKQEFCNPNFNMAIHQEVKVIKSAILKVHHAANPNQ